MNRTHHALLLALCSLSAACATGEQLGPRHGRPIDLSFDSGAPAGWLAAGRTALRNATQAHSGARETLWFAADAPDAVAYRIPLTRGQRIDFAFSGTVPGRVEVFEALGGEMYRLVDGAKGTTGELGYRATWTGTHIVRVQPEPGRGGTIELSVGAVAAAALVFPVAGRGLEAISSVFGDPRDAGSRRHEGVDIFAPRGTPVVATAYGQVVDVRETPVGGRVIWVADAERGVSYYYAHLEEQRVRAGQRVAPWDTLGTVGNSGNAAGTSPHLHFGVYERGRSAVDPFPLLASTVSPVSRPLGPAAPLGEWLPVTSIVRLRSEPAIGADIVRELAPGERVLTTGTNGEWHRVMLADGTRGFMAAGYVAVSTSQDTR